MLGLGSSLSNASVPYELPVITALGNIGTGAVLSQNDENVLIVGKFSALVAEALEWEGIANGGRIPGITASVTISHTNGEDGATLDPVVNATNITLFVYKYPNQNMFTLSNTDASSTSGLYVLDITSSPFDGTIDAVGNGNKYNIRINSLSKTGLTDSGNLVFNNGTVINAA
tara:strand:- start:52 stop:567 length:516 start_codon:yes stop_codon:yes gene_type:complete